MLYSDFLDTVKVLKMLYGRNVAEKFFMANLAKFSHLLEGTEDFVNLVNYETDQKKAEEKEAR